jgi:hypothetical protein
LLGFTKYSPVELQTFARATYVGMKDNPLYPNPPVSMEDLLAKIKTVSAVHRRGHGRRQERICRAQQTTGRASEDAGSERPLCGRLRPRRSVVFEERIPAGSRRPQLPASLPRHSLPLSSPRVNPHEFHRLERSGDKDLPIKIACFGGKSGISRGFVDRRT